MPDPTEDQTPEESIATARRQRAKTEAVEPTLDALLDRIQQEVDAFRSEVVLVLEEWRAAWEREQGGRNA